MPNNAPLNFKERSVRRAIRAVHKEDLAVERIEIARDGTISVVVTAQRPKLDLTDQIESVIDETRANGAAA
jgi:acetolactate synthase regulatory subunit